MKTPDIRAVKGFILLILLSTLIAIGHAQETATTGTISLTDNNPNVGLMSDFEVELQAIEMTTPALANSIPRFGTFYSAQHAPGTAEPWPPLPGSMGLRAWPLGDDGVFLLDDLAKNYDAPVNANLKFGSRMSAMDDLGGGDFAPAFSIPTNGLWLEITNVANGLAYLNLHHATNKVYEIWSKTDLAATNWNIELEVSPTNTTVMPFRVVQLNRPNLFLWARDWTGITSHSNTTPEWWFWKYFGTVDLSDTNLDNQGDTFRYDYTNGLDPNVITFSLQFTNTDLNSSPANGTVMIQGGAPSYIAVLVNDTNQAHAVWQPYTSSNILVSLSSGNGLYNVQVGLRGLPSDARQSWVSAQLTLDNVAPRFVVTSPTNSTVSVPMIQLQGYVSASLSKLTFDVSNVAGIFTNQPGYWQPLFYNTNLLAFTTNSFQCYDIALTNGLNRIILHATDVAGNSTTTNFSYTLDYSGDHTAPMLSLIWPTNGTSIAGSNVTVQAQMDDSTATVTATINSNSVAGLVERSGTVWFNNLPLNSGTNTVTITATDAAGNMSTTNLTIVQSAVNLTINPISSDQLNRTNVTVTGTIGDASDHVTVNGVSATVIGTNWTATSVSVSPTGTAGLNVQVNDSSNNLLAAQSMYQPQPAQVVLASYKSHTDDTYQTVYFACGWAYGNVWVCRNFYNVGIENLAVDWSYSAGGVSDYHDTPYDTEVGPYDDIYNLPAGANGFSAPWENVNTQSQFEGEDINQSGDPEQISSSSYNHTQTHVMIQPSGQQSIGQTMLYLVQAQVTNEDTGLRLVASAVRFVNQLAGTTTEDVTDTNGIVWSEALVSAPAGALNVEVTPTASGNINFSRMKLSSAIIVYFSVEPPPVGISGYFDPNGIQTALQSQLSGNVFDSPPAGHSVKIRIFEENIPRGKPGWNGNPKTSYFNRVTWAALGLNLANNNHGGGSVIIDASNVFSLCGTENPDAQTFVNILAHEGIWGNAGPNYDDSTVPDGDIASGHSNAFSFYAVAPSSRTTLRSEFGF
jgi:hypothetical protein